MIGESTSQLVLRDPDIRLMLRVRDDGDEAAFAELVELYRQRLCTVMHHLVGNSEEAEDLAQEVFLRVFVGRQKYYPRAKFSTWLFTIANHLALNHLRTKQRKPVVALNLRDYGLWVRAAEQLVKDRMHQPGQGMERQELASVVQQAVGELNERQRVAVVLNKFEDMNYAEIGEVMGLTIKAVKSLLCRARENLRTALKDYIYMGSEPPQTNGQAEDDDCS